MESLKAVSLDLAVHDRPTIPTRLDWKRLETLGYGRRVDRRRLKSVCGTASAANQWLDKASKEGLLVPVAWGEYYVVEERTVEMMRWTANRAHRRMLSWAITLPKTMHRDVTFMAPWVWRETDLAWSQPAPVVPFDGTEERAPAPLGAFGYSVHDTESWSCRVGALEPAAIRVPSRMDAAILLGANADPRWQEAAARIAAPLTRPQRAFVRRQLGRLRRLPRSPSWAGPTGRPALSTPRWWNRIHDRAVEGLVKNAYTV